MGERRSRGNGVAALCVAVVLAAGCTPEAPAPKAGGLARVTGVVSMPVAGAFVDVYRPGDDLRGPPLTQLGPLGSEARFEVSLSPGEYMLVARRRSGGEDTGPVRHGDVKSDPVRVVVAAGVPLELSLPAYVKAGNAKESFGAETNWVSGIAGQVTDPEGAPVEGVRVHVYEHVQMSERPKFVSARTGPDGRYELLLPQGGTYYLCARDKYGGPPKVGDLYGRYDQGTVEPSMVIVPEDAVLSGVDITVHPVW
ncbi:MAG TPA: carboxypeptidase-like regulatory domain-containing protein [Deferrisomatales bacterium]|nr:carboxypeptidase-like regulatory domain-containing protein [Deferrisomatales bacterium]